MLHCLKLRGVNPEAYNVHWNFSDVLGCDFCCHINEPKGHDCDDIKVDTFNTDARSCKKDESSSKRVFPSVKEWTKPVFEGYEEFQDHPLQYSVVRSGFVPSEVAKKKRVETKVKKQKKIAKTTRSKATKKGK